MATPLKLFEALKQVLGVEYTFIVYYPRLAALVSDEVVRERISHLGEKSIQHADTVFTILKKFGGRGGPEEFRIEPFPEGKSLHEMFRSQLEKEKLACWLFSRAAELALDLQMRQTLETMAWDERYHIEVVEKILSWLGEEKMA